MDVSRTRITQCNKVYNLCNFLVGKVVTDRIYRPPICPDQIVLFTIEITIEKVLFFTIYFESDTPGGKVLRFSCILKLYVLNPRFNNELV